MYALQAIETKYHGPTNYRGSRHSARAEAGRIIVSAPMELGVVESHAYAARKLAEKMGWAGRWYAGGTRTGYVFVCIPAWADQDHGTFAFETAAPAYRGAQGEDV
jgi:hypothetical protein